MESKRPRTICERNFQMAVEQSHPRHRSCSLRRCAGLLRFCWRRAKGDAARSRLAALLTGARRVFSLTSVFNVRWHLHDFFMGKAEQAALYASRRGPQALVLVALVGIFLFGLRVTSLRLRRRGGAIMAVSGALLSLALWCTEVVSLHAVDHILYHSIGNLMTVSFLWIFACMMTSIGVLVESKESIPENYSAPPPVI